MENLNDMFDLNNLIGRLRRIENDPAAQFEDIEDAFNDMIGQPIVAPIITMPAGILVLRARQVKSILKFRVKNKSAICRSNFVKNSDGRICRIIPYSMVFL